MKRFCAHALLLVFALTATSHAEEPVDLRVISQIRAEGFNNSQVSDILFYLTDVHGPRLTGSPNINAAEKWAAEKLTEWGLENAERESWGAFGRGWVLQRFALDMIEPYYDHLIAYPKAWTSGTDGVVSGAPVLVEIESEDDFEKYAGKLDGAIVLTRPAPVIEVGFEADARRHSEDRLAELAQAPTPGARSGRRFGRGAFRSRRGLRTKLNEFFREQGVAAILEPSRGKHGTLFVSSGGSRSADAEPALPALVVAAEQYARIVRLLKKEIPVKLELNVQARFTDEADGHNVVAELRGSDPNLRDELVMLGGHLDSWHSATGTTDNAAGCAVAMEAIRILKAIGVKPRRTVRIALWGGEEQGLLGSRGYVKQHFGDRATMELKPEHDNFAAYFNLDNGGGRIRGIYCQSNDAVRPIFEAWLRPFHDLDATTVTIRNTGGTDHQSFDGVGLPGFQFIQDPLAYNTRTHHTNMDTYERVPPGDAMQASVIMASFVYHAAMRDEKLPRKALPKPREPRRPR